MAEVCDAQARLVALEPERFLATLTARRWRIARVTGVGMITNIDTAIAPSMTRSGDVAVAVISEGPYVVPYCGSV